MRPIITIVPGGEARSRDLTTLETVKDELGVKGTKYDKRLRRLITAASGAIESYTDRTWARETVKEEWRMASYPWKPFGPQVYSYPRHINEAHPLRLSRTPIESITTITADADTLTSDQWEFDADIGFLWRMSEGFRQPWYGNLLSVTYTGGYLLLDDLPTPIEQACISLVSHWNSARGRDPSLRSQEVPGVLAESYWVGTRGDNGALPPEVTGLLDPFRELRIS